MAKAGRPRILNQEKWENRFTKRNFAVSIEHGNFLDARKKSGEAYTKYLGKRIDADPDFQTWLQTSVTEYQEEKE